jgi:hypothetical protein
MSHAKRMRKIEALFGGAAQDIEDLERERHALYQVVAALLTHGLPGAVLEPKPNGQAFVSHPHSVVREVLKEAFQFYPARIDRLKEFWKGGGA